MTGRFRIAKGWRDMKTIAYLTLDTLFWSKKTIFVVFISLVVLGMVVFVTLFYGTALISEEVEGKTLTYLFLRPIPKPAIMVGKYLALVWTSVLLVLPTVVFSYLILYLRDDLRPFWEDAGVLGKDIGIVFLALLAYGAFFSLLGAWLKHPILAGLIYAFGWEGIVSYLPGFTRKLTVTHYIQSIFPHENAPASLAMLFGERTQAPEAVSTLLLMTALFLAAACLVLREKEYVLEQ